MGSLNQAVAQLRDLFASMTPAARITAGLLFAVIAVSLGYLFQGARGGADEYLFGGEFLSPREADRVEAAIAQAGLSGYDRDGGRLKIPSGQKAAYLAAIADAGALPANFDAVMDESLDLGPFVGGEERRQRIKAAREKQLSMILGMMTGIDEAQVMFDIREARGFGKEKVTATVSVLPAAGETIDARRAKMIRAAVAGAIAGLDPRDVMLLNLADGAAYDQTAGGAAEAFDEPYFQTRVQYEHKLKADIEDFLAAIPGVRVQVSAELDDVLTAQVRSTKADGDPAPLRESTTSESTLSSQTEDRGRPGLQAQGPGRQQAEAAVAKNENKVENTDSDTENFIPFSEETMRRSGLVPKHVRAAVAIPTAYLVQVWRETNPDAKPDDKPPQDQLDRLATTVKDSIKNTITPLFPKELGENPYPNVEVTFFQSLTPEAVAGPSMAADGLAWASRNSGTLIMAGLALVSLGMLRSMVKALPAGETNVTLAPRLAIETTGGGAGSGAAAGSAADGGGGGDDAARSGGAGGAARPKLKLKKGPSLKDDLATLVREDPDAAASILRSWIGSAS